MNWFSHLLLFLGLILAVFFEATFDGFRYFVGAQVDFLPVLLVYAGLTFDVATIAGAAVFGGICYDSLSANPLGTSILPLFVVGILVHTFRGMLLRELVYARIVLGAAACAACPILSLLILTGLNAEPAMGWGFLWQWLVMSVLGGLATPPVFFVLDRCQRALLYPRDPGDSFRPDRQIVRGR